MTALDWTLNDGQLKRLDDASRIEYGFPRDFVERAARRFAFGQTFDQIDNHRGYPAW